MTRIKVAVGMSGGVDSSVAALLLKEQGYDVIGLFMKNWEEKDQNGVCTSARDFEDVARVCEQIEIPYYGVEFVKEYQEQVFKRFIEEYRAGFTPNPDILCNREIKFNVFFKKAMSLGVEFLATGHYARNELFEGESSLVKAVDGTKDQTYFLYTIKKDILKRVLFPVGHLQKSELRAIARRAGLATAAKKDSTGICFIGERDFREFLSKFVKAQSGEFRHLNGKMAGTHCGAAFYTLGQRKGLGLGGEGDAWYVVGKDVSRNVVFVERGDDHPALYADYLLASEISWVAGDAPSGLPLRLKAKARYRQADQECLVSQLPDGRLRVDFTRPQRALTPRQSVVFYEGEKCLGGAVIDEIGPSYFEQGRDLNKDAATRVRQDESVNVSSVQ